jgi:hypothetical protein
LACLTECYVVILSNICICVFSLVLMEEIKVGVMRKEMEPH